MRPAIWQLTAPLLVVLPSHSCEPTASLTVRPAMAAPEVSVSRALSVACRSEARNGAGVSFTIVSADVTVNVTVRWTVLNPSVAWKVAV